MQHQRQQRKNKRAEEVSPGLQGTDGVDLCDVDDGAHCFEGSAAAFSNLRGKKENKKS